MCILDKLPREKHIFPSLSVSLSCSRSIFLPHANYGTIVGRKNPRKRERNLNFFRRQKIILLPPSRRSSPRIRDDDSGTWHRLVEFPSKRPRAPDEGGWKKREGGCTKRPWLRNYFSSLRGRGLRDTRHPFATRISFLQDAMMTINDDGTRHDTGGWRAGPFWPRSRKERERDGGKARERERCSRPREKLRGESATRDSRRSPVDVTIDCIDWPGRESSRDWNTSRCALSQHPFPAPARHIRTLCRPPARDSLSASLFPTPPPLSCVARHLFLLFHHRRILFPLLRILPRPLSRACRVLQF